MKKQLLFILFLIFFIIPINTNAVQFASRDLQCKNYEEDTKTCTITICKDGCDFDRFYYKYLSLNIDNLIINILDNKVYFDANYIDLENYKSVIINGNNSEFIRGSYSQTITFYSNKLEINNLITEDKIFLKGKETAINNSLINDILIIDTKNDTSSTTINNSTIKGIEIRTDGNANYLDINNSNIISNSACSVVNKKGEAEKSLVQQPVSIIGGFVTIKNSKLNCASCLYNGEIYIDSTNEWEDGYIDRGINGNVSEENNGHVFIELKEEDQTVDVDTDEDLSLNNIFKKVTDFTDVEIIIEDESICKVEDNKIIPLKAGSTNITVKEGNDSYTLRFNVRQDVVPTPTPTSTPIPDEPKKEDISVPDTFIVGTVVTVIAVVLSTLSTLYYVNKED